VNRTSIKVIKRKDAEVVANAETQNRQVTEQAAAFSEIKIERRLHRKMADTVSDWIAERKESNRIKEISSIRKLFGDESSLSRTT